MGRHQLRIYETSRRWMTCKMIERTVTHIFGLILWPDLNYSIMTNSATRNWHLLCNEIEANNSHEITLKYEEIIQ